MCVDNIYPGDSDIPGLYLLEERVDHIYKLDQKYRIVLDSLVRKAGLKRDDPEIQKIIPEAAKQDSFNLSRVLFILDSCGWIGVRQIGAEANQALFVVIQHADRPETARRHTDATGKKGRKIYTFSH